MFFQVLATTFFTARVFLVGISLFKEINACSFKHISAYNKYLSWTLINVSNNCWWVPIKIYLWTLHECFIVYISKINRIDNKIYVVMPISTYKNIHTWTLHECFIVSKKSIELTIKSMLLLIADKSL